MQSDEDQTLSVLIVDVFMTEMFGAGFDLVKGMFTESIAEKYYRWETLSPYIRCLQKRALGHWATERYATGSQS